MKSSIGNNMKKHGTTKNECYRYIMSVIRWLNTARDQISGMQCKVKVVAMHAWLPAKICMEFNYLLFSRDACKAWLGTQF